MGKKQAKTRATRTIDPSKVSAGVLALNPWLASGPGEVLAAEVNLQTEEPKEPSYKSKTEKEFALYLEKRQRDGEIESFDYEPITLVIGDPPCRYTPDFFVLWKEGGGKPLFIEVKGGFIREAAMVRFRSAKKQYPCFEFQMWQKKNREWSRIL